MEKEEGRGCDVEQVVQCREAVFQESMGQGRPKKGSANLAVIMGTPKHGPQSSIAGIRQIGRGKGGESSREVKDIGVSMAKYSRFCFYTGFILSLGDHSLWRAGCGEGKEGDQGEQQLVAPSGLRATRGSYRICQIQWQQ